MRSPFFIVTLAVALGTLLDAIVKVVALDVAVISLTMWRFIFGSVIGLTIFILRKRPFPKAEAFRFHAIRGAIQVTTATTFFWSLTQIALAEATALGFTSALMVPPIAKLILGERISTVSVIAAGVGFAGAAFALSASGLGAPEDGNRTLGTLAALAAAFGYAITLVLLRLRTRSEDTETLTMFGNVMPMAYLIGFVMVSPAFTGTPPPFLIGFENTAATAVLGCVAFTVWWLMSMAYRGAEAQRLAPFEYLALPASVAFGWFLFGEEPHWRLYVGALIVVASCLAVAFEDRLFVRPRLKQA